MFKKKLITLSPLPFSQQFREGLAWNLFDSVGAQGFLILFHICFRHFFGALLHGVMGCTLSLLYLGVIIANIGLDASLAPFFEFYTHSKKTFRSFLLWLMLPQLGLLTLASLIFYHLVPTFSPYLKILITLTPHLSATILILICSTFIVESMRKTVRTFLKIAFYTQFTAWIEVMAMAAYVLFITYNYYYLPSFGLLESWRAMLIIAIAQLVILCLGLYHFYNSLPASAAAQSPITDSSPLSLLVRIGKTRLFAWANQCMHQLFSGNFLVPVCAIKFGIEQASMMKIFTSIAHWITLISQKVFGITGNALLAHLKSHSLELQKKAFTQVTSLLNHTMLLMLIFLLINGKKLALMESSSTLASNTGTPISWPLLYFLLLLSFFESLFIMYEKWYILEEKAWLYFLLNAASFGLLYSAVSYIYSPAVTLIAVILIRVATFAALTLLSYYRWQIKPEFTLRWPAIIISIVASLLFHFFF